MTRALQFTSEQEIEFIRVDSRRPRHMVSRVAFLLGATKRVYSVLQQEFPFFFWYSEEPRILDALESRYAPQAFIRKETC